MILKLRIRTDKNGIGWRLLDKVRKIDYEFVDEAFVIEKLAKHPGIMYVNNYPRLEKISGTNPKPKVVEVFITYEDKVGDLFYTDDMVFIMNDNGKTCDTINV